MRGMAGPGRRWARDAREGASWWVGASCGMAGLLNYLVFLSANVNSPLTTSVVGPLLGPLFRVWGLGFRV